jgi:exodeoxyribonuclease V alpha subunit
MMFLQGHGISTLFAVRIYKEYGDKAIAIVTEEPYKLAHDFYGIGFFSADNVALSIGLARDSKERIMAAIRHVLAASREQGHCYLRFDQIQQEVNELLDMDLGDLLHQYLSLMEEENLLKVRYLQSDRGEPHTCYYSKSLYFDEELVAEKLRAMTGKVDVDLTRATSWAAR